MKVELGLETIFKLSDDELPEDFPPPLPPLSNSTVNPQSTARSSPSVSRPPMHSQDEVLSVIDCLKKLGIRKESKNVFKQIDYDKIATKSVQFLPP